MKVRNKKTGEMGDLKIDKALLVVRTGTAWLHYASLVELNEEWEDYEEQKDYYIINLWGEVCVEGGKYQRPGLSELGLTFETKEEAELAVRKLKAWKRLKDKGFRVNGWMIPEEPKTSHIKLVIEAEMDVPDSPYDLDICFGGEE